MSYIAKVKVKKYIYLYECNGYREDGKVKSKRISIGKINPKTNEPIYKSEYIERMKLAGSPIAISDDEPRFSVNQIKNSSTKELGLTEFLDSLAETSGLREALEISNPRYCNEIFAIAKYLASNGDPFMHCQEWIEKVEILENLCDLSSQNISKILSNLDVNDREKFYQAWANKRSEKEYLALDITSTSSYSELIDDVEWGYNRDGEKLAQINLCLLMGETSRLPIYQTVYPGSLRDVSTLKTTFAKFDAITNGKPIIAIMDKGFYSKKNIDDLLSNAKQFTVAVPFSSSFAKKQVENLRYEIDDFSNNIVLGCDTLRAVSKKYIHAHVFYNPIKATIDREKLYKKVTEMFEKASAQPEKYFENNEFSKFLDIKKNLNGYVVQVKKESVKNSNKYAGWLVLISNHVKNPTDAIKIYRAKNVVEKGFLKIKNNLDLARTRVHSDSTMQSKVFICFVALILLSHVHNIMSDKGLYKNYTMKQLMRTLSKNRVQKIGDSRIEYPKTKEQRDILSAFGL